MIEFLQAFLFSEVLIFVVLVSAFAYLTHWALMRQHERTGYVLGWLIGLFFIVVYASTGGQPRVEAQAVGVITLSFLEVAIPAVLGIGLSIGLMWFVSKDPANPRWQSLKVAGMTAVGVILLFVLFTEGAHTRRMMAIFALAFSIGSLTTNLVLSGRQLPRVRGQQDVRITGEVSQIERVRQDYDQTPKGWG